MAPRSPVILQYGGLKVCINDMACLPSVLSALRADVAAHGVSSSYSGGSSDDGTMASVGLHSAASDSTRDISSDTVWFNIYDAKRDMAAQTVMPTEKGCDTGVQTDCVHVQASVLAVVDAGVQAEQPVADAGSQTVMSDVPEVQMESALRVDRCVGTCDPMFSQAEVVALLDMKVLEIQAQVQPLTAQFEQCRADLDKTCQSRDLLSEQLQYLQSILPEKVLLGGLEDRFDSMEKRLVLDGSRISSWADEVPADLEADILISEDCDSSTSVLNLNKSKKEKKLHRRSRVRAS
eukprot:TRINITY_DN5214_c0_g3_i2.p1 TRINITY_DN5214_c0_g3~~TRINITY_DN5214_c0_g3_i2.p1  ORF type:complete len:292 (-),score=53.81 TRINITY_DN5214_c0_g3_i2:214-1089(-)